MLHSLCLGYSVVEAEGRQLLEASCGHSTHWAFRYPKACPQIIKSALNPQERNVLEDNPQDTKSSLSKNDPDLEMLVKLVSQSLSSENFPFVLPLTKKRLQSLFWLVLFFLKVSLKGN